MGPQAPDWAVAVGEKMLDWGSYPREAGPPGPRLNSLGERERNAIMANRVGVNMLQFCLVSNSLSHKALSINWEVYFSKELCRSSLLFRRYDSACICVCILGHGYATDSVRTELCSESSRHQLNSKCPFHLYYTSLWLIYWSMIEVQVALTEQQTIAPKKMAGTVNHNIILASFCTMLCFIWTKLYGTQNSTN